MAAILNENENSNSMATSCEPGTSNKRKRANADDRSDIARHVVEASLLRHKLYKREIELVFELLKKL